MTPVLGVPRDAGEGEGIGDGGAFESGTQRERERESTRSTRGRGVLTPAAAARSRPQCVPIEAGELEFCDAVAYDSCVRIQEYWRFDNLVAMQYDAVLQEWKDTLTANDQAALIDPGCDAAFKAYFCYAAFPKCWEVRSLAHAPGLARARMLGAASADTPAAGASGHRVISRASTGR